MATAAEYTDPYLQTYTRVPASGTGVCAVCHSGPRSGYAVCYSCETVMRQVTNPTRNVIPISLYTLNSQLWHVLRHFKDGSGRSAELLALQVAAIIARFTAQHLPCTEGLAGGRPTIVTSVPSTRAPARLGRHPLETAITRVGALAEMYEPLLKRGPAHVDHNLADDHAFTVRRSLRNERVLLLDDTLTTGARLQSAASALRMNGASAVIAVVVGRVINPDWNENCRRIWDQARETEFSFDQCCLCGDPQF
jgi:hypothetical protein